MLPPTVVIGLLAASYDDPFVFSEIGGNFSFCIVRGGFSSSDEFSVTVTTTDGEAGNHDKKRPYCSWLILMIDWYIYLRECFVAIQFHISQ